MDKRKEHETIAKNIQRESTVGKLKIGEASHVSHFKDMFAKKGIFKLGDAAEETEEMGLSLKGACFSVVFMLLLC